MCCGELFDDFEPLAVESWLVLRDPCLVLDLLRVLESVLAGLAVVALTEPELPPLRLGDELIEFCFCSVELLG